MKVNDRAKVYINNGDGTSRPKRRCYLQRCKKTTPYYCSLCSNPDERVFVCCCDASNSTCCGEHILTCHVGQ